MSNMDETTPNLTSSPGVFSLTSDNTSPTKASHVDSPMRQGAIPAEWTISDESATSCHDAPTGSEGEQFPMIVWLRGDEPWFSQFDMDAEAVMKAVGIKRSRLTQIAGRDLRVGRVRVDRYIRPVFRSIDVARYLDQTRATASHQKSSAAIKTAADSLQQQIDHFQNTLETIGSNLTNQINAVLATQISDAVGQANLALLTRLDTLQADVTNRLSVITQDAIIKSADALVKELHESNKQTGSRIASLEHELKTMLDAKTVMLDKIIQNASAFNEKASHLDVTFRTFEKKLLERITFVWEKLVELEKLAQADQERSVNASESEDQQQQHLKLSLAQRAAPSRRRARGYR